MACPKTRLRVYSEGYLSLSPERGICESNFNSRGNGNGIDQRLRVRNTGHEEIRVVPVDRRSGALTLVLH